MAGRRVDRPPSALAVVRGLRQAKLPVRGWCQLGCQVDHFPCVPADCMAAGGAAGGADNERPVSEVTGFAVCVAGQCAEIDNTAAFPQGGVSVQVTGECRVAHDIAMIVDSSWTAVGAAEGAEGGLAAVLPEESAAVVPVEVGAVGDADTDDLAAVVDRACRAVGIGAEGAGDLSYGADRCYVHQDAKGRRGSGEPR